MAPDVERDSAYAVINGTPRLVRCGPSSWFSLTVDHSTVVCGEGVVSWIMSNGDSGHDIRDWEEDLVVIGVSKLFPHLSPTGVKFT